MAALLTPPTHPLERILEYLDQADDLSVLQTASADLRDYFGITHIAYRWVDSAGEPYDCGTYDDAWRDRYRDKDYLRLDPVVAGCFQRFHPVDWKQLDWSAKAAQQFRKEAIAYGVGRQGYSIPVRGPNGQFALFTANHDCRDKEWALFTEAHRREMILAAHCFNEKAQELEPARLPAKSRALSPREVDAMTFLAIGYSRAQVASTLSISEHTLRVYIESARFKLGAVNTTHAVARALSRGLIVG